MRRKLLAVLGLLLSGTAHAGDKVLYQATPDWVKPAPAIDATKLTDGSPIFLMLDQQQKLQNGQVWAYADVATRIASTQSLTQAGTVKLPWEPDQGDLIIHRMEIVRGAEHIDLIAGGQRFSVLRREEQLEQLQINGELTATLAVQGLRVGDVLHFSFSTTRSDSALKGNVQTALPLLAKPENLQYGRVRLLWPDGSDVKWRNHVKGVTPVLTHAGGFQELTLPLPVPALPELPQDTPLRFRPFPALEASSFADWQSISRVMAPLYKTQGAIAAGSPLAQEVATIAAASSEPRVRAAMALRLVQDKIRYLFNGMDGGNYTPQSPTQTWSLRYGDCKAKTLLLLAILRELKIEAEPVLAAAKLGDLLPQRLPSPSAFNHVLVRATIGGESLWLDGTDGGARLADIGDTPNFHYVLPVRDAGAELMPIAMRPSARPEVLTELELDQSAGVQFPAPYRLSMTFRGGFAEMLRLGPTQLGQDKFDNLVDQLIGRLLPQNTHLHASIASDDAAGTTTIKATGIAIVDWSKDDGHLKTSLDHAVAEINFDPDRSRPAWQDLPVAGGDPSHTVIRTRIHLPGDGKGFTLEGDQILPEKIAGASLKRSATLADGWLTTEDRVISTGEDVPPSAIAATRAALATAKAHLLRGVAPADYPQRWAQIASAKQSHRFDPIMAYYAKAIAEKPNEVGGYAGRAWFLESIYDRQGALNDLNKLIALQPSVDHYQWRARLYSNMGQYDKALADLNAARALDPGSGDIARALAELHQKRGDTTAALALLSDRIAAGGKEKADDIATQADVLADAGRVDEAMKALDAAIVSSPGNPELLNNRCWLKGTHNVALDTALKDCTKAIELSEGPAASLDSRAMVYFRMNRFDDALADLNAALDTAPELPASLYLRGVIRTRNHDPKALEDLNAARMINPEIDTRYGKWGIKP